MTRTPYLKKAIQKRKVDFLQDHGGWLVIEGLVS
jgi:hypothetical protein